MSWKFLVTFALLSCSLAAPAAAESNVMVIFDASGSMKRPAGNESRIVAAKRIVSETLSTMPTGVRTGLLTYGHRRAKDCSDIEVVSPIGADEPRTQARMVQGLDALGETPIAAALDRAGQSMRAFAGQKNAIVLVTDGIEECRGDPCAAADRLNALGIGVKVHVVGFALNPDEKNSLQCVVQKTGGRYFDAADANGLRQTFAEVKQLVAEPLPRTPVVTPQVPATRASKVIFTEKFDGKDVPADSWEILNRNADRYIVEKGELLLVNPGVAGFQHKDAANIVRLLHDMPDGDWDIVIRAKLLFQSGTDGFSIGLMTDEKSFLRAMVSWITVNPCQKIEFEISRVSGADETKAAKIFSGLGCGYQGAFGEENTASIAKALETNGVRIVLMKRDRKYSATLEIDNWVDAKNRPRKVTTDELTSLRVPGRLSMQVGKVDPKKPSETSVRIDEVQIVSYE